ncbi:MAG: CBS domain-containing protein [Porcipelethomonas sp.]
MRESLIEYIVSPDMTIMTAIKKIDQNDEGFVVVTDSSDKLLGILTEADVRKVLIAGTDINELIDTVYMKRFISLKNSDSITSAIDLFRNNEIEFIPVSDENGKLINIVTRSQLYSALLGDISVDLTYDFSSLGGKSNDYRVCHRPWGFYKTTIYNNYFQSKIICVKPGAKLSLQSHSRREEHWIITHGTGIVQIGESDLEARCGNEFFIPKGCKHRLMNTDEKESLMLIEVQLGDYFGEDDIIRYEDIYGRI